MQGKFVVFEGIEGCGKSSAMKAIVDRLQNEFRDRKVIATRHPGATPLGAHLRTLLQFPERIDPSISIDTLSEQLLMVADMSCFINTSLIPSILAGDVVCADRFSIVSGLAYGVAGGVDQKKMCDLLQLATMPKASRLYVLQCPWAVAKSRLSERKQLDRFERNDDAYFEKVQEVYDNLIKTSDRILTVSQLVALKNIVYVDATRSHADVVDMIWDDLKPIISAD